MYVPRHFQLPEDYARALLSRPGAGNLVTVHDTGPEATMVPFYFDEERNALVTHLVKNNPQAVEPVRGPGLVILDDVDAYISPHWYVTNEVKANVPTWDYITIHVRGEVRIDPGSEAALIAATRLTDMMEADDRGLADELEKRGETRMAEFLRTVSLPYAEQRFAVLARLRGARALHEEVRDFH